MNVNRILVNTRINGSAKLKRMLPKECKIQPVHVKFFGLEHIIMQGVEVPCCGIFFQLRFGKVIKAYSFFLKSKSFIVCISKFISCYLANDAAIQ